MKIFHLLFFFVCFSQAQSQTFLQGRVLDESTGTPLSYVNIGIVGKNVGTVSNPEGIFTLQIAAEYDQDTLRFSMIGYESLEMVVSRFKEQIKTNPVISLTPAVSQLREVIVRKKGLKEKKLGNKTQSTNVVGGFSTDLLGNEIGVVMKIKRSPTYLKDFNCFIARNKYGKIKFRLNIYELENGMPGKNIVPENIFVETDLEQGLLTVDLTKYNIWVETDFLVTLEWIEDLGKDGLYFSARLMGAPMIARETSQGDWGKVSLASLGFNVTVRY